MHSRGTLQRVNHLEFGDVIPPHSPIRFGGEERLPVQPSRRLGEHTYAVLSGWLGYKRVHVDTMLDNGTLRIGDDEG